MIAWITELFKDSDGRHSDEMAVLSVAGVLTYLGLAIYSVVWKGQPFDYQSFGIGLGSAIGAASLGMGFKAKLDPPQPPNTP